MPTDAQQMQLLASQVRTALQSADLEAYRELLDPACAWGPPDDATSGCHSRDEVLAWYRGRHASGARADVVETVVGDDTILVGLEVHGTPAVAEGDTVVRWQVLTVAEGRITDIRGFDDRDEALGRMG